jgi:hypothetical protein
VAFSLQFDMMTQYSVDKECLPIDKECLVDKECLELEGDKTSNLSISFGPFFPGNSRFKPKTKRSTMSVFKLNQNLLLVQATSR